MAHPIPLDRPHATPREDPHSPAREVVVGLVNDGSALTVALRGVELAASLGASVRFVQVVPAGLGPDERADAESATFAAGLRALRHGRHQGATFESPVGDPAAELVRRSATAVGLVLGEDRPVDEATVGTDVARYCRDHARCPVHVVARPSGLAHDLRGPKAPAGATTAAQTGRSV